MSAAVKKKGAKSKTKSKSAPAAPPSGSGAFGLTESDGKNHTIHVGEVEGYLEDEGRLKELFGAYGTVDAVTLRIKRKGGKVSWALIHFKSAACVKKAIAAAAKLKKKEGIVVRPVDNDKAKSSTGAMARVLIKQERKTHGQIAGIDPEILTAMRSRMKARSYQHGGQDPRGLLRSFDKDSCGELDFDEFLLALRISGHVNKEEMSDRMLKKVFHKLDDDDSGAVGIDELTDFVWPGWRKEAPSTPPAAKKVVPELLSPSDDEPSSPKIESGDGGEVQRLEGVLMRCASASAAQRIRLLGVAKGVTTWRDMTRRKKAERGKQLGALRSMQNFKAASAFLAWQTTAQRAARVRVILGNALGRKQSVAFSGAFFEMRAHCHKMVRARRMLGRLGQRLVSTMFRKWVHSTAGSIRARDGASSLSEEIQHAREEVLMQCASASAAQRIRLRGVAKSVTAWRDMTRRKTAARGKHTALLKRIQHAQLARALVSWKSTARRGKRVRIIATQALSRRQSLSVVSAFTLLRAHRNKMVRARRVLSRLGQRLVSTIFRRWARSTVELIRARDGASLSDEVEHADGVLMRCADALAAQRRITRTMGTWRLHVARARHARITSRLHSVDSVVSALRESLEKARKEVEEAARTNAALDQTNQNLAAAQAVLSDEASGLSQEKQKLHEMVCILRGENGGLCAENQRLREVVLSLRGENEALRTENLRVRSNADAKGMGRLATERGLVYAAESLFSRIDRMASDDTTRSTVRAGQGRADG
jgi:hypothetical protein